MNLNNSTKTYLEIFKEHYPNVVLKGFYGNYCPAGFFKYGMDMHHPDCTAECDKCWLTTVDTDDVWCENGEYDVPEEWKEISVPAQTAGTAVFDMQTAEQTADVFNYAVLSAEMGDYLKRKEEQLKNEYMNFTANCGRIFAEAQEKLAKHGFGENNGIFEKWITSMGFKKSTVYEMIKIHKFRSSEIRTNEQAALFDGLSKSLQYEIAKPSAPPELVDKVMSGDITTHKEYIALKKELESTKGALRNVEINFDEHEKLRYKANEENVQLKIKTGELEKQLAEAKESLDICEDNVRKAEERAEYAENKVTEISIKKYELEQHIKELESRPVDVAVQSDSDAERKFNETIRKINLDFENFRAESDRDLADMRNQRNAALDRAEAAEAQLNAPKEESDIKPILMKMTLDDLSALTDAVSDARLKEILKKAQVLRI